MNEDKISEALPHIHQALSSLVQCWDELHDAEGILETVISVDDLSDIAVDLDYPEDSRFVTVGQIADWLKAKSD